MRYGKTPRGQNLEKSLKGQLLIVWHRRIRVVTSCLLLQVSSAFIHRRHQSQAIRVIGRARRPMSRVGNHLFTCIFFDCFYFTTQ